MVHPLLIYGANGYTGELIARAAVAQGLQPLLAGRSRDAVAALATDLGLPYRIFELSGPAQIDAGLADTRVVLHCAGPFHRTAAPMAAACIRTGVHYLDITGEIEVFERMAARGQLAEAAGVMLLPGAGFDVVPTDCLAAHLHRRLPTATHLTLAFQALGSVSRGTATTAIEQMGKGNAGLVRRNGELTSVPTAWKTRDIDFGRGPRATMTIPWGDVSTAYHSTDIPNIEVYMALKPRLIRAAKLGRYFGQIVGLPPVQSFLKQRVQRAKPGPTAKERAAGVSYLWGEARDDAGGRVESRMQTPEGYALTVAAALLIAQKMLAGQTIPGFQTPSSAFGPDLILEIDGVSRQDL